MSNQHTVNFISNMVSNNTPPDQFVSSYHLVKAQNDILANNIDYINQMYSTDTQNIIYQQHKIHNYKYFNSILFIIYLILMIIAFVLLFRSRKIKGFWLKIFVVILFVLYPFFAYYVESYLYEAIMYVVAFLSGETYKKTTIPKITNTQFNF